LGDKLKNIVTWIDTGIVALNGDAAFHEVNAELGEYRLPVEPLSAQKTISQFIKEGGIGYNSQKEGTLGSSIFQLSSTFSGKKFQYGSKYKNLYNAGYPLHRIMEGPLFSKELSQNFGPIEKIILPVKKTVDVDVFFHKVRLDQLHISDRASNVFFINDFAAELMGLEGEGIVKTYWNISETCGKLKNEVWEKRFLEDEISGDHNAMKFFTVNSQVSEIYKVFNDNARGLFFALHVHNGILLLMSGKRNQLSMIGETIRRFPLTFEIGILQ